MLSLIIIRGWLIRCCLCNISFQLTFERVVLHLLHFIRKDFGHVVNANETGRQKIAKGAKFKNTFPFKKPIISKAIDIIK